MASEFLARTQSKEPVAKRATLLRQSLQRLLTKRLSEVTTDGGSHD